MVVNIESVILELLSGLTVLKIIGISIHDQKICLYCMLVFWATASCIIGEYNLNTGLYKLILSHKTISAKIIMPELDFDLSLINYGFHIVLCR